MQNCCTFFCLLFLVFEWNLAFLFVISGFYNSPLSILYELMSELVSLLEQTQWNKTGFGVPVVDFPVVNEICFYWERGFDQTKTSVNCLVG